jgi:hypothetical protein
MKRKEKHTETESAASTSLSTGTPSAWKINKKTTLRLYIFEDH